jgi:ferredoxin
MRLSAFVPRLAAGGKQAWFATGMRFERRGQACSESMRNRDMAYKIIASQCTVCGACEFECPNAAIRLKNDMYIIDPKKCTECEGHFDKPQCAVVCPVENTCVPA